MTNVHSKIKNESDIEQYPELELETQECDSYECICWLDIQWKNCRSYEDLINCMVKYIKGEILNSPLTIKPFDCSDQEFKNCLIKLNEYGCFTIDSQEFKDEIYNYFKERKEDE